MTRGDDSRLVGLASRFPRILLQATIRWRRSLKNLRSTYRLRREISICDTRPDSKKKREIPTGSDRRSEEKRRRIPRGMCESACSVTHEVQLCGADTISEMGLHTLRFRGETADPAPYGPVDSSRAGERNVSLPPRAFNFPPVRG